MFCLVVEIGFVLCEGNFVVFIKKYVRYVYKMIGFYLRFGFGKSVLLGFGIIWGGIGDRFIGM